MEKSRTTYVIRNIMFSYLGTIATSLFSLICRTVFIYTLGEGYLGVSGLFTNVLGILSFSELGLGTAINFSLYKPIAENDTEKIKSLLKLYKTAYRLIALVVSVIGLALFPFLEYLVNTEIPMSEINRFYLIFLFNTVSSYFVTYKTSYISALQKHYIVTNANAIGNVIIYSVQVAALLMGSDYLSYLIIASVLGVVQKIVFVLYLNRRYPILVEKNAAPLDPETKHTIWVNVKALIAHKIGDIAVNQTDNIIISVMLSTTLVGLMSNYTTLYSFVALLTNVIFTGNGASIGNLVAKESRKHQKDVFEMYEFMGFWVYGFVLVAFVTLVQPFVTLWVGEARKIDDLTMVLFFVSKYLEGQCMAPFGFKAAAGKFKEDRWVPFAQAVINLSVSILAVKWIGLPGVFVGTIAQRLLVNYMRPHIVYKYVLEADEKEYFLRFTVRLVLLFAICVGMRALSALILPQVTVLRFAVMVLLTGILPNAVIVLLYCRTPMFRDLTMRLLNRPIVQKLIGRRKSEKTV